MSGTFRGAFIHQALLCAIFDGFVVPTDGRPESRGGSSLHPLWQYRLGAQDRRQDASGSPPRSAFGSAPPPTSR